MPPPPRSGPPGQQHKPPTAALGGSVGLVAQSCLTLVAPVDCIPPGSSVRGILQARILDWAVISFFRGSARPRGRTHISCVAGGLLHCRWDSLPTEPPGKPRDLGFTRHKLKEPSTGCCFRHEWQVGVPGPPGVLWFTRRTPNSPKLLHSGLWFLPGKDRD